MNLLGKPQFGKMPIIRGGTVETQQLCPAHCPKQPCKKASKDGLSSPKQLDTQPLQEEEARHALEIHAPINVMHKIAVWGRDRMAEGHQHLGTS